jgi:VWFA-related protein
VAAELRYYIGMRSAIFLLLIPALSGQAPDIPLRSNVQLVVAPTVVTDRQGRFIRGLTEENLTLYDNNVPVKLHLDDVSLPISLVVAIQTTASARDVLEKLRKELSLVEPLLTGQGGDAAVIAFADSVHTMQPFTPNPDAISNAIQDLEITGEGGSGIDAVVAGLRLLSMHEGDRRRVILLISEKHDRSSKAKLDFALARAQRANATIYSVTFSPFLAPFTNREPAPPNSDMNLTPIFGELKHAAQKDMADAFAKSTGGREFGFLSKKGLDEAVARIGEDLHGQYLISFQPRNLQPGEFHKIRVEVKGHADYVARTRVGYWAP